MCPGGLPSLFEVFSVLTARHDDEHTTPVIHREVIDEGGTSVPLLIRDTLCLKDCHANPGKEIPCKRPRPEDFGPDGLVLLAEESLREILRADKNHRPSE